MVFEASVALDLETKPNPNNKDNADAALHHLRNQISLIALVSSDDRLCTRVSADLSLIADEPTVTHGGKFDFKTLLTQGAPIKLSQYQHDTMLQAVALAEKIPETWLEQYDLARKQIHKEIGKAIHRPARGYSLKTLAPYFLGVEPFWEVEDHDNEEYAFTDSSHTLRLHKVLTAKLQAEGGYDFYWDYLMPWSRMLLKAELRGVRLNLDLLPSKEEQAQEELIRKTEELRQMWHLPLEAYRQGQEADIRAEYEVKKIAAIQKLAPSKKKTPALAAAENVAKLQRTAARYQEMADKAVSKIEPFNFSSPPQLMWLFRDHFGYDMWTFDGKEESTGAAVLQRLADDGHNDVREFLRWRELNKLVTSFFPTYRAEAIDGIIYTNFKLDGARTGRLSCSDPNLQQVPGHLHELFIPRPGYKFICYDLANIEPLLIAYLTEDPELCHLMLTGRSFHDKSVEMVFGIEKVDKKLHKAERDACKAFGLSLLYGAGYRRIRSSLMEHGFNYSVAECKGMLERFKECYQRVYQFKSALDSRLANGELVRNILGRPVVCTDEESIFMQGFNTLAQGSASDLLLESVRQATERFEAEGLDAHLLLVVHDEVVVEAAEKDAARANQIVQEELTRWEMPTPYGVIRTACEGGIFDCWSK